MLDFAPKGARFNWVGGYHKHLAPIGAKPGEVFTLSPYHPHLIHQYTSSAPVRIDSRIPQHSKFSQ
jgi:hypothetical protein